MNNSESYTADAAQQCSAQASTNRATFDNPMGTPALTLALTEHEAAVTTLRETIDILTDRMAPVVDYAGPPSVQPVPLKSSALQSPTPKLYEKVQAETARITRMNRELSDLLGRLTV